MSAYEKYADLFMTTMAGEMSGLNRDQILARMKDCFPNEADFIQLMQTLEAQVQTQIVQATAKLQPGQALAFGHVFEQPAGPVH